MNGFVSLAFLGTFSGMVAATTALTQVLKHFFARPDPKWFALFAAAVLVLSAQVFVPGVVSYENVFAAFVNIFIVAGAAVGLYEGVKSINN